MSLQSFLCFKLSIPRGALPHASDSLLCTPIFRECHPSSANSPTRHPSGTNAWRLGNAILPKVCNKPCSADAYHCGGWRSSDGWLRPVNRLRRWPAFQRALAKPDRQQPTSAGNGNPARRDRNHSSGRSPKTNALSLNYQVREDARLCLAILSLL
jgi:hypothetical protein